MSEAGEGGDVRGIDYQPPVMSNGRTWADEAWWQGKPEHNASTTPATFDEATALTWARCWAYGEEKNLTTREWHLMWPIVYAALNACAQAWPTPAADSGEGAP